MPNNKMPLFAAATMVMFFSASSSFAYTEHWGAGFGTAQNIGYYGSVCDPDGWVPCSPDGPILITPGCIIRDVSQGNGQDDFDGCYPPDLYGGTPFHAEVRYKIDLYGAECVSEYLIITIDAESDPGCWDGKKPSIRSGTQSSSDGTWTGLCQAWYRGRKRGDAFPVTGAWQGAFTYDDKDPYWGMATGTWSISPGPRIVPSPPTPMAWNFVLVGFWP